MLFTPLDHGNNIHTLLSDICQPYLLLPCWYNASSVLCFFFTQESYLLQPCEVKRRMSILPCRPQRQHITSGTDSRRTLERGTCTGCLSAATPAEHWSVVEGCGCPTSLSFCWLAPLTRDHRPSCWVALNLCSLCCSLQASGLLQNCESLWLMLLKVQERFINCSLLTIYYKAVSYVARVDPSVGATCFTQNV